MLNELKRTLREAKAFADYLKGADLHKDWTLPGAKSFAAMMIDGRKDMYAMLFMHAENTPQKPAIVEQGRVTDYRALNSLACRFGNGAYDRGARRGDKIIIALGNTTEALVSTAGGSHLGAVVVPASKHYLEKELSHIVTHADAKIVCLTQKQWHAVGGSKTHTPEYLKGRTVALLEGGEGAAIGWSDLLGKDGAPKRERRQRDPDIMMYTSGTTGKPKGAMLNMHKVTYVRAYQILGACGFSKYTRFYTACPAYHAAPTAFIGFTLSAGGSVHLDDRFDAERVWRYLDEAEITTAFLVPTQINRLMQLPPEVLAKKPRALQRLISGGAPLPLPQKQRALREIGPVIYDFYGATELGLVSIADPQALIDKPGTIGLPFPGVTVKFLDEQGKEVPRGEKGTLYVTSDQFDFGYYKNADATQKAFTGEYRTVGDIGYVDADGYLFLVDRKSDMIISGGVNIYPAEIEQVLLEHPAIEDVAIVGAPDEDWGETVAAFVVVKKGHALSADEVVAHCTKQLASLKKPKRVEFLAELPRNPTGKILKSQLRERLKSG
ncbi:MAG: acyl--CoA ligase [Deltaproteobacteria bacterium]|nr:acyl--CoA ligase [Deltaproteobacteria bacterium]